MESDKNIFRLLHKRLESLVREVDHRAWKIFPFLLVDLVVGAFFTFDVITKEGVHLLFGSVFLVNLNGFTVAVLRKIVEKIVMHHLVRCL